MLNYQKIFQFVSDSIFPRKCLSCGIFLIDGNSLKIEPPFDHFSKYFCADCLKPQLFVTSLSSYSNSVPQQNYQINVNAASTYDGVVKESIHLLKYNGKTALAEPLGHLLFNAFIEHYQNRDVDFIVPIPLYSWKMFQRGFNQSFLLVRDFNRYWLQLKGFPPKWKIAPDILIRKRNTKSQTGFNRQERRENIRGAFALKKGYPEKGVIRGSHIVLVDDVHTTGATTNEAAKILLDSGAASVGVIVVAQA